MSSTHCPSAPQRSRANRRAVRAPQGVGRARDGLFDTADRPTDAICLPFCVVVTFFDAKAQRRRCHCQLLAFKRAREEVGIAANSYARSLGRGDADPTEDTHRDTPSVSVRLVYIRSGSPEGSGRLAEDLSSLSMRVNILGGEADCCQTLCGYLLASNDLW